MRILNTIPNLDIKSGGPSTCTYYLLKGLNRFEDVQADILTLKSKDTKWNDSFIKYVSDDSISSFVYSRNLKRYLFECGKYDLYHANSLWTYPSHITNIIAQKVNSPFILSPHGMLYPQALSVSKWKKYIAYSLYQRKDIENATVLHATCSIEMQYMRDLGLKNTIAVIPNCLYVNRQLLIDRKTTNSVRRFGFIGRINRIKNIDRILYAWKCLGRKTSNSMLEIIGSGDKVYETELKEYVQKNKFQNVIFLGFLSGERLQKAIRQLDFLILPSKSENFGMVVPEALINRVPVIASRYTPWEELNTYLCGWWVDNDVQTLHDIICEAIEMSESDRIVMGNNGRNLVLNKYTVEQVSSQMKHLYEWILNGGQKPDFVYE